MLNNLLKMLLKLLQKQQFKNRRSNWCSHWLQNYWWIYKKCEEVHHIIIPKHLKVRKETQVLLEKYQIYIYPPQKDSKLMISWDYYKILVIWRKERQKLMHLSDNTPNKLFKFKMKNWVKMNVDSCSKYNTPIAILI